MHINVIPPSRHRHCTNKTKLAFSPPPCNFYLPHSTTATLSRHFLLATFTSLTATTTTLSSHLPAITSNRSPYQPMARAHLWQRPARPRSTSLTATLSRHLTATLSNRPPYQPMTRTFGSDPRARIPPRSRPLFRTSSLPAHGAHRSQRLARQHTLGTRGASFTYHGRSNRAPAPT